MEKISLSIQLESLDNKIIKVKVDPSKPAEEVIETIISNPKINLQQKTKDGIAIHYGLWFGKDNIAMNLQSFESALVNNGDILVLRPILGENTKEETTEKKISKRKAAYISAIIIAIIATVIVALNWNAIFNKKTDVSYKKSDFTKEYMGFMTENGKKKKCELTIKQIKDDWMITYDLYIDREIVLENKDAKIEPSHQTIKFLEASGNNEEEKIRIRKLDVADFTKTPLGGIKIKFDSNFELTQKTIQK